MAIQMRRGLKVSFDPQKMLPGEWAVSIDQETENQIIWMCFRAGVVKRMGTYEDFREQVLEMTDEIAERFKQTLNEIKTYMEGLRDSTEGYKDETKIYMDAAENYKNVAERKAEETSEYADLAKTSETNASVSAINAANSADLSEDYSLKSKSYAVGTDGEVRPDDNSDCAEFYYEQTKRIAQGIEGIIPMGTITFAELSLPQNQVPKYMFDISDDFISDERFKNGSGIYYGAGSNVIRTADDMWDVLAATSVSGVKGDKEEIYRQGFVNITPENIGAATREDVEEIASQITGVNADFVGTKEELETKIASGEVTDGMTAYITDDNSNSDGDDGEKPLPITVDAELSETSENPVQNKVITNALKEFEDITSKNLESQIDSVKSEIPTKVSQLSNDSNYFVTQRNTHEQSGIVPSMGNNKNVSWSDDAGVPNWTKDWRDELSYGNLSLVSVGKAIGLSTLPSSNVFCIVQFTDYDMFGFKRGAHNLVVPSYLITTELPWITGEARNDFSRQYHERIRLFDDGTEYIDVDMLYRWNFEAYAQGYHAWNLYVDKLTYNKAETGARLYARVFAIISRGRWFDE